MATSRSTRLTATGLSRSTWAAAAALFVLIGADVIDAIAEVIYLVIKKHFRIAITGKTRRAADRRSGSALCRRALVGTRVARFVAAAAVAITLFWFTARFGCFRSALGAGLALAVAGRTRLAGLAHLRLFRLDGAGVEAHQIAVWNLLLGHPLNALEQFFLVGRDQRDGFTAATGSAGTADAVHIIFLDVR